jgi:segregation and condensation protein A
VSGALSHHQISLAKVEGVTWQELPKDLYIPPQALEVAVENFEGPLDLLLYLIRKQNLDILNISVAKISRQYIAYIKLMQELQLELAGEYLLMAALLAEIKSQMLLPKPKEIEGEDDDPRANLIAKLREYERVKKVTEKLNQLPRQERDIFPTPIEIPEMKIKRQYPSVVLTELLLAFKSVLNRAEQFSHHQVMREPLSLKERMNYILEQVKINETVIFITLFTLKEGRAGVVICFLAILELSKEGFIEILQAEPFAQLRVRAV